MYRYIRALSRVPTHPARKDPYPDTHARPSKGRSTPTWSADLQLARQQSGPLAVFAEEVHSVASGHLRVRLRVSFQLMPLEINPSRRTLEGNPGATSLVHLLDAEEDAWGLVGASVYLDFPIYRDTEGGLVGPQLLLLSPAHGVLIFGMTAASRPLAGEIEDLAARVTSELQHIYGRLLPSKVLPKTRTHLAVPVNAVIYAPNLRETVTPSDGTRVLIGDVDVGEFLSEVAVTRLKPEYLQEIQALIDGTKGLRSPKRRDVTAQLPTSKGVLAAALEAEIATLDHRQKHGAMVNVRGAQRIRGIAGSGKTVVLAMKAALAQVLYPDSRILYTFHTRSLYQHIRYLITRAYRNRDYHDPNWELLSVLHSWGGQAAPGVYSMACALANFRPLTFSEAKAAAGQSEPFAYACANLLSSGRIQPYFDFTFIDEGQDFPPSFLQLCAALTKDAQFVVAYDELQTIFQAAVPNAAEMFGTSADGTSLVEFEEDIVLHKCYRNPRQILVCAHAIGLGIYGERIAQMPENEEHWNDLGYRLESGEMAAGSEVVIVRPEENSPNSISRTEDINESIKAEAFDLFDAEITYIADSIVKDLGEGLRPDDVMVASLDNRNAQSYISHVSAALTERGIRSHDVHAMQAATGDFSVDGHVTLTTISKAKGNEAYMVYLAGVDAAWGTRPIVRQRNLVFTGLTRAKGWVRVTGIGDHARAFKRELERAKRKYPKLEFTYPSAADFRVMRRDLEAAAAHKVELERLFEHFTLEEIETVLQAQRAKAPRPKRK